jgi:hypothetical protein
MKYPSMRLVVYLLLNTAALSLVLVGNDLLFFAGLICCLLSSFFSQRPKRNFDLYLALPIILAGLVFAFVEHWRHEDLSARNPMKLWQWTLFIGAWIWTVVDEFRRWKSNRRITNATQRISADHSA